MNLTEEDKVYLKKLPKIWGKIIEKRGNIIKIRFKNDNITGIWKCKQDEVIPLTELEVKVRKR